MRSTRQEAVRGILLAAFDSQSHPGMTAPQWADLVLSREPAGMWTGMATLADSNGRPLLVAHELGVVMRGIVELDR